MVLFLACNTTTPDKYIAVTTLNSNLVSTAYRPMFLKELRELKSKDRLPSASAADYIRERAISPIEESIEKVTNLNETAETKALIAASLEVMTYGKEVFENDYLSIAQLLDEGRPDEEIDTAIAEMYAKTESGIAQRFEELDSLALRYAKAHDVPFEVR